MNTKGLITNVAFFFLLATALFTLTTPMASAATLSVGQGEGDPGEQGIVVPITLSSGTGEAITVLIMDLSFDPSKLSLKGVVKGPAGKAIAITTSSGKVRVVMGNWDTVTIGDGVILNATFDILSGVSSGDTALTITKNISFRCRCQKYSVKHH